MNKFDVLNAGDELIWVDDDKCHSKLKSSTWNNVLIELTFPQSGRKRYWSAKCNIFGFEINEYFFYLDYLEEREDAKTQSIDWLLKKIKNIRSDCGKMQKLLKVK